MNATTRSLPERVRFRRPQRLLRVFRVALMAGLMLVIGCVGSPVALAEEGANPVRIEITALTPSTLGPADTLSVSGRIINVSDQAIGIPQVLLWRSGAPLRTRQDLDSALVSEQTSPVGSRVTVPGAYTEDLGQEFAVGASATFTVSASVDELGFGAEGAAYLVGVQMRGVYGGRNQTVGRARTLVPFGAADPVELTTAVQLDSRPSLATDGTFTDNHLEQEVAPGGRLSELLAAASRKGVSVLIDPALPEQVRAMTGKYRVRTGAGVVEGTQQGNASAWLRSYEALTGDRWRVPYAHPDLLALARHSKTDLLKYTLAAGKRDKSTEKLPLAVIAAGGWADRSSLRLAATLEPAVFFLHDAAVSTPFGRSSVAPKTTLVNYGSAFLEGGPSPAPQNTTLQARQRLLAELFLTESPRSRVLLVNSVEATRVLSILDAPWLNRVELDEAIPTKPPAWPGELNSGPSPNQPVPEPLSAKQLKQAQKLAETYATIADLQGDSTAVESDGAAVVAKAISSWWRGLRAESAGFVDNELTRLRKQLNGTSVRLSTPPPVVMAGRDGHFPISVTNDLDVGVTVQVVFTADNPQRLRIPKITDVEVGAGESVTLNAAPHANSNGTYAVRAQLRTTGGEDIGKSKSITVEASNVGKAGWILVIGAGVILIGGTVLRIRQVRRGETVRRGKTGGSGSTTGVGQ